MKKILFIFIAFTMLFTLGLYADDFNDSVKIKTACNLRDDHCFKVCNSSVIGQIAPDSKEYKVLGVYHHYYKIEAADKKTDKTISGFVWAERVDTKRNIITGSGVNVREGPSTNYKVVATLWPGSKINKIVKGGMSWVKIKKDNNLVWVYKDFTQ